MYPLAMDGNEHNYYTILITNCHPNASLEIHKHHLPSFHTPTSSLNLTQSHLTHFASNLQSTTPLPQTRVVGLIRRKEE